MVIWVPGIQITIRMTFEVASKTKDFLLLRNLVEWVYDPREFLQLTGIGGLRGGKRVVLPISATINRREERICLLNCCGCR